MPRARVARLRILLAGGCLAAASCAGPEEPVRWSARLDGTPLPVAAGGDLSVRVTAKVARGWYFYSTTQPPGGPVPARIWLPDSALFSIAGDIVAPAPSAAYDSVFGLNVEKHLRDTEFVVPVAVSPNAPARRHELRVNALYQACNNEICLSPRTVTLAVPVPVVRSHSASPAAQPPITGNGQLRPAAP